MTGEEARRQYICSICGRVFPDREGMERCAASHLMTDDRVPVAATYANGATYPVSLDATMTDGSVVRYRMFKIVKLPPEEKTAPKGETEVEA